MYSSFHTSPNYDASYDDSSNHSNDKWCILGISMLVLLLIFCIVTCKEHQADGIQELSSLSCSIVLPWEPYVSTKSSSETTTSASDDVEAGHAVVMEDVDLSSDDTARQSTVATCEN